MNIRSLLHPARFVLLIAAVCVSFFQTTSALAQTPEVKGHNVTKVTYQGPARVQTLAQTGPERWTGGKQTYQEEADRRDEWSVYLVRGKGAKLERVQIDLYTKKVTFFSREGEEAYRILSSSSRKE